MTFCAVFEATLEGLFAAAPEMLMNEYQADREDNENEDCTPYLRNFSMHVPAKLLSRYLYEVRRSQQQLSTTAVRFLLRGNRFTTWRNVRIYPNWLDNFVFSHNEYIPNQNDMGVVVSSKHINEFIKKETA